MQNVTSNEFSDVYFPFTSDALSEIVQSTDDDNQSIVPSPSLSTQILIRNSTDILNLLLDPKQELDGIEYGHQLRICENLVTQLNNSSDPESEECKAIGHLFHKAFVNMPLGPSMPLRKDMEMIRRLQERPTNPTYTNEQGEFFNPMYTPQELITFFSCFSQIHGFERIDILFKKCKYYDKEYPEKSFTAITFKYSTGSIHTLFNYILRGRNPPDYKSEINEIFNGDERIKLGIGSYFVGMVGEDFKNYHTKEMIEPYGPYVLLFDRPVLKTCKEQ